ncbi:MAG TPA: hypothetical protein PLU43_10240, partial [Lachnospiraceae bacterium]|nr:hypothetical protein [Lachnospiraceae bacterium]
IKEFDMPQILHIDRLCNECGNCASFCPYTGEPYRDKLTLFASDADFENSDNQGFLFIDKEKPVIKVRTGGRIITADGLPALTQQGAESGLAAFIRTVYEEYGYLYR